MWNEPRILSPSYNSHRYTQRPQERATYHLDGADLEYVQTYRYIYTYAPGGHLESVCRCTYEVFDSHWEGLILVYKGAWLDLVAGQPLPPDGPGEVEITEDAFNALVWMFSRKGKYWPTLYNSRELFPHSPITHFVI